jgi:deoxyribodipyrimidine photolyase-related protein
MQAVTIVFPHQLFEAHPAIRQKQPVYLVEEWLFFCQYRFHLQKIVLHRASMQCYADFLRTKGLQVNYIEAGNPLCDIRKLIAWLASQEVSHVAYADPADFLLRKRISNTCKKHGLKETVSVTPNFLNSMAEANAYFDENKTYFQTAFYIDQRKKRHILVDAAGQPSGNQWSFDASNRLKFPKKNPVPVLPGNNQNNYVEEAKQYAAKNFAGNYGDITNFRYPVNFQEAEKWLDDFLAKRFEKFGDYEDAIVAGEHYLHHSVISPLLNIGLLSPQQVIKKTLAAAARYNIPLNSTEGFVRQLTGWREFIRIVYEREGVRQRTTNYWQFSRKIPASFWRGDTGILPVDNVIQKNLSTGYNHHIERLMVMGNFMLLCEFDPNEVYRWFMEMYADAYDWVMVPNVYGMTQFADGGLMTTKPYISGSNYLLKMSDYAAYAKATGQSSGWTTIWDGLFWRFMHVHRDFFLRNPRLGMLVNTFDKMPADKRNQHLRVAEKYLNSL